MENCNISLYSVFVSVSVNHNFADKDVDILIQKFKTNVVAELFFIARLTQLYKIQNHFDNYYDF